MKFLIYVLIFLGLFQSMHGSLFLRRKSVPLDLDGETITLSQHAKELTIKNSNEDVKVIQRQMSRAYVGLMDQLQQLRIKGNTTEKEFCNLCLEISKYKKQHLELLQKNKLLYDDGHDRRDNHFNSDLLAQLRDVAQIYNFSKENIPSPVHQKQNIEEVGTSSDDEF